jgi:hypothetical protein
VPFTPSHAIVALPFVRTPLVPAAIAIGAMTPDAPLFFRVGPGYWVTHDWLGAALVDLPLGLGFLLVWTILLRPAVPALAPGWLRSRLPEAWSSSTWSGWWQLWGGRRVAAASRWRAISLVAASLAIGIATHLIWDAFTHPYRWGSVLLPVLAEQVGPLRLWDWVQHVCSLLGLLGLGWWAVRWLGRRTPRQAPTRVPSVLRWVYWASLPLCLAVAGVAVAAIWGAGEMVPFLSRSGTAGAAGILVVTAVAALIAQFLEARHARDAP